MITAAQMRAARALLGIDQRELANLSGLSQPTIQRMEASEGVVRGVVDTLMRVVEALEHAGVELLGDPMPSGGLGRGVRLKEPGLSLRAKDAELLSSEGSTANPKRVPGARDKAEELPITHAA